MEADLTQMEIDSTAGVKTTSNRIWVLFLWLSGAGWMFIGGLLALLANLKMVNPDLLSTCPWLTYGKVEPASNLALIYGGISQFLLGAILFVVSRLTQSFNQESLAGVFGSIFWNIGVTLGVIGIFMGDSTGFASMEAPRYASSILFVSFLIMGGAVLLPLWNVRSSNLYASTWYILAGILGFAWVYFGGHYVISWVEPTGITGAIVASWSATNLLHLWIVGASLGLIYYIIPKLTGVSPNSSSLAALAFWTFIILGSGSGLTELRGGPFPQWLIALGVVFKALLIVPLICLGLSLKDCLIQGKVSREGRVAYIFGCISVISLASWMALSWISSCAYFAKFLTLSWFQTGLNHLAIYGVAGGAVFSVIFFSLPRYLGRKFCCEAFNWFAALTFAGGLFFVSFPLVAGGVFQGGWLLQADLGMNEINSRLEWVMLLQSLGWLALIGASSYVAFQIKWSFYQVISLMVRHFMNNKTETPDSVPTNKSQEGVA